MYREGFNPDLPIFPVFHGRFPIIFLNEKSITQKNDTSQHYYI